MLSNTSAHTSRFTCCAFGVKVIIQLLEGLDGVYRQPVNGRKLNRQPSKTEDNFYRQPTKMQGNNAG